MKQNRKKLYIFIVITVIIVAAIFWGTTMLWGNYVTQKLVTFEPTAGSTITFGTQYRDEPVIAKEIVKTNTKLSKRLQPGNYVAIFSADGYKTETRSIVVDSNMTVKTPVLDYTDEKLAEIFNKEKPAIHSVALAAVDDGIDENVYTITGESLYGQADWYYANLTPQPPNDANFPDLKIILKKSGNSWKVAAKPTTIYWIGNYQNIPEDVIRATNKLGFY